MLAAMLAATATVVAVLARIIMVVVGKAMDVAAVGKRWMEWHPYYGSSV